MCQDLAQQVMQGGHLFRIEDLQVFSHGPPNLLRESHVFGVPRIRELDLDATSIAERPYPADQPLTFQIRQETGYRRWMLGGGLGETVLAYGSMPGMSKDLPFPHGLVLRGKGPVRRRPEKSAATEQGLGRIVQWLTNLTRHGWY
jgi:hypothetical protein